MMKAIMIALIALQVTAESGVITFEPVVAEFKVFSYTSQGWIEVNDGSSHVITRRVFRNAYRDENRVLIGEFFTPSDRHSDVVETKPFLQCAALPDSEYLRSAGGKGYEYLVRHFGLPTYGYRDPDFYFKGFWLSTGDKQSFAYFIYHKQENKWLYAFSRPVQKIIPIEVWLEKHHDTGNTHTIPSK